MVNPPFSDSLLVSTDTDHAERVGEETIDGTRIKRGDAIINIVQEGFGTFRLVVEAKRGKYALRGKDGVLRQLSDAMEFRDAVGGIAVVTKEYAGKRQRTFDRIGHNRIVVVVDPEDEVGGFLPLEVAYSVLRASALANRNQDVRSGLDPTQVEDTITHVENSLNQVQSIKTNCTMATNSLKTIHQTVESIESEIRTRIKTLRSQLQISK